MTVLAASRWKTNAELVADIAALYFKPDDVIVDLTYHRGTWWKKYDHPGRLVACSRTMTGDWIDKVMARGHDPRMVADFRNLKPLMWTPPEMEPSHVDVFAFDPPYVAPGGRTTSTIEEFNERYGLVDCAATPRQLHAHNSQGLEECYTYLKPGGLVITKCMDYISSGKMVLGTHWMLTDALAMGFECVDRFEHIGNVRQQPAGRRQVHARRNLSTMFVFKKPGRRKK